MHSASEAGVSLCGQPVEDDAVAAATGRISGDG